jgi:hypothetical protein
MDDRIDLRPLFAHPGAAEILLLARGQLNRAFRAHGLIPPGPLPLRHPFGINPTELDDPAAMGIENARLRFREAFAAWADEMPTRLVRPVLDILWQAHKALAQQRGDSNGIDAATLKAYEFLQARYQPGQGHTGGA